MSDPMAEIKASFFVECEELLESLFDALQSMSDGSSDAETINVAFRAVHSIKGGAGAFALDDLVSFAHVFETTMDDLRAGKIEIDDSLINLFYTCSDVLSDLVRAARDETAIDQDRIDPVVDELKSRSSSSESAPEDPPEDAEVAFQPMTLDLGDLGGAPDAVDLPPLEPLDLAERPGTGTTPKTGKTFLIDFTPEPELYTSGNETLFFLRALADLGPCTTKLTFNPPDSLADLDVLGQRLSWSISLETTAEIGAISEVFEFAEGLCRLTIAAQPATPPASELASLPSVPEPAAPPVDMPAIEDPAPEDPAASTTPDSPAAPAARDGTPAKPSPTVRVSLDRIDRLVNLVGELVINQSMLSQSVTEANLSSSSALDTGLEEFLQLTRDIQESVMMIRAQPVKSLFQRMSRIVRESSASVGKTVKLVTEGDSTEIDKTAIERLADPLTHMIRNSVDHGLEDSEARRAAGKPETGEIRLSASHKSGRVVIEVSDDGAGINREKVLAKAIEKELVPADVQLADSEIDQLLFLPGFSTSDKVSNLSGRGVGMDVVRSAITALGGKISIASTPGRGTTFSISLPLTLAVVDGMIIGVENETLVVPLSTIGETLTLEKQNIRSIGIGRNVLQVRNEFLPLLDLGKELGYRTERDNHEGGIALLIAQEDGSRAALIVDDIEDQRQVVIKGLQESYGHVPGIAAATILGDGQIALILDPGELIENATGGSAPAPELQRAS